MPRWFWGAVVVIIYVELMTLAVVRLRFPLPPDPVFQKPAPTYEYNWTKGPYDNDWDFCWTDDNDGRSYCASVQI